MTAAAAPARTPPRTRARRGDAFAGTGALARLMLRRDRVKLPAWTLGISVFVPYFTLVINRLYSTPSAFEANAAVLDSPLGRMFAGPVYGLDEITVPRYLIGAYGVEFLIMAAVMSILLVSRHTRAEEQNGRAELVRAAPVGRLGPLTAALLVAAVTNTVLAVLITAMLAALGFALAPSVLFAAGAAATGMCFAGVTALASQIAPGSGAAAAASGLVLAAAHVVRACGDLLGEHGSPLSWFSPLAWPQQTAPFVFDRWWPLALSAAFAAAAAALAYALAQRRDFGAGLIAVRAGRAQAPRWLRSAPALALRLQRRSLLGWGAALALLSLVYGGFAGALTGSLDTLPAELLGTGARGGERLLDAFFALIVDLVVFLVAIRAVLGVRDLRAEESGRLAEPVLAAAVSRRTWMAGHVAAAAGGALALLAVAGAATGIGGALATGDATRVWGLTAAFLGRGPEVLALTGLAAAVFGAVPRLLPLSWAVLAFGMVLTFWGRSLDLPLWVRALTPFGHTARMPLDEFAAAPVLVLGAVAVVSAAIGLYRIGRRDMRLG